MNYFEEKIQSFSVSGKGEEKKQNLENFEIQTLEEGDKIKIISGSYRNKEAEIYRINPSSSTVTVKLPDGRLFVLSSRYVKKIELTSESDGQE